MKITSIIGARPQFVKAAVISQAIRELAGAQEIIVHTGQHFDANMSEIFFDELDIPRPQYQLGIGGGSHGQNTGRMIEAIESVLVREKPDWVLVYGDTDSTLAGVLAAVKLQILVAHVEAGLRSFNRRMPEEINRVLTDHAADVLFTPTRAADKNLAIEGIPADRVCNVGDVMYDAALYYGNKAEKTSRIMVRLGLKPKEYVLATMHRQENVDDHVNLNNILQGFAASARTIILPLHPRTRKRLGESGLIVPANVRVIEPVGYLDMVMLEKHAAMIATDSGGVQKEAYFHQVPCITLRAETEWMELVEAGVNRLVGTEVQRIADALKSGPTFSRWMPALYGIGDAGKKIVERVSRMRQQA